jgi:AcrR family transcriptional regulator
VSAHNRTQARGDARREQILDVALKSFAENGYRGSSIADIAAACGMSQAGLLHHFRTKADLLAGVLERRDRADGAAMSWDEPVSGIVNLRKLKTLVRANSRVPGLVKLFTVVTSEAVAPEHPAHKWVTGRYSRLQRDLADSLQRGIDDGSIRPDVSPDTVARQVFAMMDGLQVQWLLAPRKVKMGELFADYIETLITRIAT